MNIDISPFKLEQFSLNQSQQKEQSEDKQEKHVEQSQSSKPAEAEIQRYQTPAVKKEIKQIQSTETPVIDQIKLEISPFRQNIKLKIEEESNKEQQIEEINQNSVIEQVQQQSSSSPKHKDIQESQDQSQNSSQSSVQEKSKSSSEIESINLGISPYQLRLKISGEKEMIETEQKNIESQMNLSSQLQEHIDRTIQKSESKQSNKSVEQPQIKQSLSKILSVQISVSKSSHKEEQSSVLQQIIQDQLKQQQSMHSSTISQKEVHYAVEQENYIGGGNDGYIPLARQQSQNQPVETELAKVSQQLKEKSIQKQREIEEYNEYLDQFTNRLRCLFLDRRQDTEGIERNEQFIDFEFCPVNPYFQYELNYSGKIVAMKEKNSLKKWRPLKSQPHAFFSQTLENTDQILLLPQAEVEFHKFFKKKCKLDIIKVPNSVQNYTTAKFSLIYMQGAEVGDDVQFMIALSIENPMDEAITFKNTSAGHMLLLRIEQVD